MTITMCSITRDVRTKVWKVRALPVLDEEANNSCWQIADLLGFSTETEPCSAVLAKVQERDLEVDEAVVASESAKFPSERAKKSVEAAEKLAV